MNCRLGKAIFENRVLYFILFGVNCGDDRSRVGKLLWTKRT